VSVRFHFMNAEAARFPPARLPVLPVLGGPAAAGRTPTPCVFDDGRSHAVHSARAGIALALRLLDAGAGQRVLLPAYHCASMVEPVLWAGAQPVFYRVDRELRADLDDVRRCLTAGASALVASHYFGVPQPLRELTELCRKHEVPLIEDCAHALFGTTDTGLGVGAVGDFAVASLPKFFPTGIGGLLRRNRGVQVVRLRRPSLRRELRGLLSPLETAARFHRGGHWIRILARLRGVVPAAPLEEAAGAPVDADVATEPEDEGGQMPAVIGSFRYLDPNEIGVRAPLATRALWRWSDRAGLAAVRRDHWQVLVQGLAGVQRARVMWDRIPENCVPYMLPLLLERPEQDFAVLKRLGVPLFRWEDMAETDCPVAAHYRVALVQVPCHQGLTATDLRWLVARLREVLGGGFLDTPTPRAAAASSTE